MVDILVVVFIFATQILLRAFCGKYHRNCSLQALYNPLLSTLLTLSKTHLVCVRPQRRHDIEQRVLCAFSKTVGFRGKKVSYVRISDFTNN